jgi:electron transfer flavoprotein alpha subunit
MSVLVIAEHNNALLKSATLNTTTAATTLSNEVDMLVIGYECINVIMQASKVNGVCRVLTCEAEHYRDLGAENIAAFIVEHGRNYTHILMPSTPWGKSIAPRVAALLDVAQISDVVAIKSSDTYVRPTYAGNVLTTVRCLDPVTVLTIRTTNFEPAGLENQAVVERIAAGIDLGLSQLLSREIAVSARPELATAKIVVSGGRGLGSGEKYHALLEPLADKLNAALGASRAAVDAGFVSNDYQVGQTGKIVAPDVYFAIGISGAIQHLAGMKESKVIVAINKDPDAPIFQVADFGLIADLFDAVPELCAQI